jgi:pyrimidine oxygenase
MAGLTAVTSRIQLFAPCAVLTMPPPIAARMAVTIDSISRGRFGVNIISGWQRREYTQMGIWPGAEHYRRRYDYCAEYVTIMRELWESGRSDLKGDFFQMDDCRCLPLPTAQIPIICAAQSDAGTRFAAQYADYNFCGGGGVNQPTRVASSVARLVQATADRGRDCGALILQMIIADETDAAAIANGSTIRPAPTSRRWPGVTPRRKMTRARIPTQRQTGAGHSASTSCRPIRACSSAPTRRWPACWTSLPPCRGCAASC